MFGQFYEFSRVRMALAQISAQKLLSSFAALMGCRSPHEFFQLQNQLVKEQLELAIAVWPSGAVYEAICAWVCPSGPSAKAAGLAKSAAASVMSPKILIQALSISFLLLMLIILTWNLITNYTLSGLQDDGHPSRCVLFPTSGGRRR